MSRLLRICNSEKKDAQWTCLGAGQGRPRVTGMRKDCMGAAWALRLAAQTSDPVVHLQ